MNKHSVESERGHRISPTLLDLAKDLHRYLKENNVLPDNANLRATLEVILSAIPVDAEHDKFFHELAMRAVKDAVRDGTYPTNTSNALEEADLDITETDLGNQIHERIVRAADGAYRFLVGQNEIPPGQENSDVTVKAVTERIGDDARLTRFFNDLAAGAARGALVRGEYALVNPSAPLGTQGTEATVNQVGMDNPVTGEIAEQSQSALPRAAEESRES